MIVTLEVLPWLSELVTGSIAGKVVLREEIPDRATLRMLLVLLAERYVDLGRTVYDPVGGRLTGHSELAVNGELYDVRGGLDQPLCPGDTITFMPGIAGGLT